MSDPTGTTLVLEALLEARHRRDRCVLATVAGFKGSTPRKPGAKMLVMEDGRTVGTIGGGALEHELTAMALEMMGAEAATLIDKHLTHELGMCCGGGVTILMEPQTYSPELLLFGAGHVAQPLARVAGLAGFDVTVIDDRAELATSERFPSAGRILVEDPTDVLDELRFDSAQTYVVIVTHDHALDERLAAAILPRSARFVGVIGSDRKREMFRKRLCSAGLSRQHIDRMRTPAGLEIHAETPGEIAVSIVAEMIATRRRPSDS